MFSKTARSKQAEPRETGSLLAAIEADPVASIQAACKALPTLSTMGLDYPGRRCILSNEVWAKQRALMTDAHYVRMFVEAAPWIAQAKRLPHMNRQLNSFYWKHVAEAWGANNYIMNGMFIAACVAMGVRVKADRAGPNAMTNLG